MRIEGRPQRRPTRHWPCLVLMMFAGCHSFNPALQVHEKVALPPEVPTQPEIAQVWFLQPVPRPDADVVPIGLDTVLRLAQDKNGQLQIARARLGAAQAGQDIAKLAWIPQISAGPNYYRHEGGIQDFEGNLIHSSYGSVFAGVELRSRLDPRDIAFQRVDAERKVWQQHGELSKLTSETLLDAAGTYLDLMTARAGEELALEMEKLLTDLLAQADALAKVDPGMRIEVERVEAELRGHRMVLRKVREGAGAASAKLAYLLGMDPASTLTPIETRLAPLDIVDADQPVQAIVEKALTNGPGVRELEGLLRAIDETRSSADGAGRWVPALEMNVNEGAFGAGPGSRLNWDNQLNIGLGLRWNLTDALTAKERLRQADLTAAQAHLGYRDLRAKLTLGATEAREAIRSGRDQTALAQEQVRHADKSYQLSASRLREAIKGRSPSEVLMAIRGLGMARLQTITTVRDFNKAQIRLLVLTGAACGDRAR
jgi:outer membrane protein TolC